MSCALQWGFKYTIVGVIEKYTIKTMYLKPIDAILGTGLDAISITDLASRDFGTKKKDEGLALSAFIFDMDGVLLDSETVARSLWQEVFREAGYTLSNEEYQKVIGRTMEACKEIFHELFPSITSSEMDELFSVQEAKYNAETLKGNQLKPGVKDLLEYFQAIEIPCALGSSTYKEDVWRALKANAIFDYFKVIVAGDMVPQGKPAPDIFLRAAFELGYKPKDCVVVEDSKNGLLAAVRAGIPAIMVPDLLTAKEVELASCESGQTPLLQIDKNFEVFDSLTDLQGFLESVYGNV